MDRKQVVFDYLNRLGLAYEYYEHPETPNHRVGEKGIGKRTVRNIVRTCSFGTIKETCHYLVVFDCEQNLAIHDLEPSFTSGEALFCLGTAHGAIFGPEARFGFTLRTDQRHGEPCAISFWMKSSSSITP